MKNSFASISGLVTVMMIGIALPALPAAATDLPAADTTAATAPIVDSSAGAGASQYRWQGDNRNGGLSTDNRAASQRTRTQTRTRTGAENQARQHSSRCRGSQPMEQSGSGELSGRKNHRGGFSGQGRHGHGGRR